MSRVNYTTTVVDNGNLIDDVNCSEGSAATPTSQTWTVNDDGAFECGVSCGNSGPGVVILYQ